MSVSDFRVSATNSLDIIILFFFYRKFGLDENTIDFIGHAVALHSNDSHLHQPAYDTVMRMKVSCSRRTLKYVSPCYRSIVFDSVALNFFFSSTQSPLLVSKEVHRIYILSMGWENCLRFFF